MQKDRVTRDIEIYELRNFLFYIGRMQDLGLGDGPSRAPKTQEIE